MRASIDGGLSFMDADEEEGGVFMAYDSRIAPSVSSVTPSWSPAHGGGPLTVTGYNLAPTWGLECHFDEVRVVQLASKRRGVLLDAIAM